MIFPGERRFSPSGVMSRIRFSPSRSSHRVTVLTQHAKPCPSASSRAIRRADHFFFRRQDSISSSTQIGRRVGRFAGALEWSCRPSLAVLAEAADPFRERGAGDVELGGDVRDRAADVDDLGDCALSSDDGQWGITVVHGTGLLLRDGCLDTTHRASPGALFLHPRPGVHNVMTRNS